MRVAVLGLGFMGSTHLKALKKLPGVQLVAVASDDELKAMYLYLHNLTPVEGSQ